MKKKPFWSAEKILAVSAIFISVSTLFTILYQTNLMRKQQYASVLPYLEVWNSGLSRTSYNLVVVNNGIGPAFIDDIRVVFDGKEYPGDPMKFYLAHIIKEDTIRHFHFSYLSKGRLIPPGERIEMMGVDDSRENAKKLKDWFGGDKAKVEIEFSSVYGEKWLTGKDMKPQKIE